MSDVLSFVLLLILFGIFWIGDPPFAEKITTIINRQYDIAKGIHSDDTTHEKTQATTYAGPASRDDDGAQNSTRRGRDFR